MPSFDLHCRYALITYAQCGDLSPTAVGEFFEGLGFKSVVGREKHADGGLHLHCFVDFGRKRRFRRADCFDISGRHPNVAPSRGTPEKGYDYAIKDDDVEWKSLDRPGAGGGGNGGTRDKWAVITGACDRESFWDLVHELDPKSAACSFTQLQKYCDWKFAPVPPVYGTPDGISFTGGDVDGRDLWLSQSGIGSGEALIGQFFPMGGADKMDSGCRMALGGSLPPAGTSPSLEPTLSCADLGRQMYVNLCIRRIENGKDLMGSILGTPHLLCGTCQWR